MLFNHGFHGYHSYWTDHWYRDHPWAWRPHSSFLPSYWWRPLVWDSVITWGAGYLWRDALADTYVAPEPVYYNYGDNIVYDGDMVYVNGVPYVSADEYYQQTVTLANEGADTSVDQPEESWTQTQNTQVTDSDPDNQWMPLGSFAVLSDPKQTSSHLVLQLAMNKKGVIRGNAYNQVTDKVQQIEGAVDHETQRVAFRITGDKVNTVECGLWNLTQESLPILVHEGKDKTLTRTLIRLNDPDQQAPKE